MKVYYDNVDTSSSANTATLEKPSPAGGAAKASYTITEQAIIEAAAEKLWLPKCLIPPVQLSPSHQLKQRPCRLRAKSPKK